jgi:hypothetical protein
MLLSSGGSADHCEISGNGWGVAPASNAGFLRITDCTLSLNSSGGIYVASGSLVKGNTIDSGPNIVGIYVYSNGNRIESNTTRGTAAAITRDASAADNLVICNWHYGGQIGFANFNPASNMVGPVISTAGTITSTNPWANFTR